MLARYTLPAFLLLFTLSTNSWARAWTNTEGKTINADFIKLEDGIVHLKKGHKIYKVPLQKLSKAGQLTATELAEAETEKASPAPKPKITLPIKLNTKISGPDLTNDQIAGKPIVLHAWQAHCGACPPSLADFEKLAKRKKKSNASFIIWHSHDKLELAKSKSAGLRLKLPVYHGGMIKWDKKFGSLVWPHVILIDAQGKIIYMGKPDRTFQKVFKNVSQ